MNQDLKGKVALVTGAGSGIGRECAIALATAGAAVAVTDINEQGCHDTVSRLPDVDTLIPYRLDVTQEADWNRVVSDFTKDHGPVSVLVSNAALKTSLEPGDRGVLDLDLDTWDRILNVNLKGSVLGCRAVLPGMLEAKAGSIVLMSSIGGLAFIPDRAAAYSAAKGGLNALTRNIAVTYVRRGVRCNAIAPGVIIVAEGADEQANFEEQSSPITGRTGRPSDIASAVTFLASDASAFINGHVLVIDGGLTVHLPGLATHALTDASKS